MDRGTRINRVYQNRLKEVVLELMNVMCPGEQLQYGAKKLPELVGRAACELAVEYEMLTGQPILDMLDNAGATTVPELELPRKAPDVEPQPFIETPQPISEQPQVTTSNPEEPRGNPEVPQQTTSSGDDALPLG